MILFIFTLFPNNLLMFRTRLWTSGVFVFVVHDLLMLPWECGDEEGRAFETGLGGVGGAFGVGMRNGSPGYGIEAGWSDGSWFGGSEGVGGWGWSVHVEAGDGVLGK
jgi:hypothetical protein